MAEAARLMDRHQTRFLLVTGEDGKLLGVVTARDLLRVFLRPDVAIKAEISRDVLSRYLVPAIKAVGSWPSRTWPDELNTRLEGCD